MLRTLGRRGVARLVRNELEKYEQAKTVARAVRTPLTDEEVRRFSARVLDFQGLPVPEVKQALTHLSMVADPAAANSELVRSGRAILRAAVASSLQQQTATASAEIIHAAAQEVTDAPRLYAVGCALGLEPLTRWNPENAGGDEDVDVTQVSTPFLVARAVEALVALLQKHRGESAIAEFVCKHVAPARPDALIHAHVASKHPRRDLARACKKLGLDRTEYRISDETGRYSSTSMYVVSVHAGSKELGQGMGASMAAAQNAAAQSALRSLQNLQ